METEIFSSGLTYRPQASGENCQRKRTFLQMLSSRVEIFENAVFLYS